MNPDDEADRIRTLLREAHRGDEPLPPFEKLVREPGSGRRLPRHEWALRAATLASIAVLASAVIAVSVLRERPPPAPRGELAWSWEGPKGPLDFLLELPRPPPLEAFPSLWVPPQTKRR